MAQISGIDVITLLVLLIGAYRGFSFGAVREMLHGFGMLVAFLIAARFMQKVGKILSKSMGISPDIGPGLAFIVIFLIISILVYLFVREIRKKWGAKPGTLGKLMGAGMGMTKGILLLSCALMLALSFSFPSPKAQKKSKTYPYIGMMVPAVWTWIEIYVPKVGSVQDHFQLKDHAGYARIDPEYVLRNGLIGMLDAIGNAVGKATDVLDDG